jgi:hypothetical protein
MSTLGLNIPQSADGVDFEGGYDPNANAVAAKELDSSTTQNNTTYGPQRVVISAVAGYVAAAGGNPTATTGGSDTSWSFASKVNHLLIQNNTTANVQFDLDTATSAGSPLLYPGQMLLLDVKCTAVHLLTAANQNINGTTAGNIVIRGWL